MRLDDNIAVKVLEERGIGKGEEKAKSETARRLAEIGLTHTKIAEAVDMPISWVEDVLKLAKA